MFPRALEQPPATGERPFATLADLAMATAALERAGAAIALVIALGAQPTDPGLEGLDTAAVGRALLVRRWLRAPADLRPLASPQMSELARRIRDAESSTARRATALDELRALAPAVESLGAVSPAASAVLERWIDGILRGLPSSSQPE
jgi:hypothetical protein